MPSAASPTRRGELLELGAEEILLKATLLSVLERRDKK
jgi:hypothetical protein